MQAAYILHVKPYRETSAILQLFTLESGRVDAVLRGARSKQRRASVREFSPLMVQWQGRADLKTLTTLECVSAPLQLQGKSLFAGMYLNELLVRLLAPLEPQHDLFAFYVVALSELQAGDDLELVLRRFEWRLLDSLGFGVDWHQTADTREPINADARYRFIPDLGFIACGGGVADAVPGRDLLAIAAGELCDAAVMRSYKMLNRRALQVHLGDRPLASRELFKGRDRSFLL